VPRVKSLISYLAVKLVKVDYEAIAGEVGLISTLIKPPTNINLVTLSS